MSMPIAGLQRVEDAGVDVREPVTLEQIGPSARLVLPAKAKAKAKRPPPQPERENT
ncbi:hypothetical protein [Streptomyces sp. NBC_01142]|uniref:hypothetical protein n=1 Tax=Streptomyces sp. NBC_01142 TaxID=2975865 RepID=UPI002251C547|nr:hypothetical protein [Streptomyces sp. NBC_01142]